MYAIFEYGGINWKQIVASSFNVTLQEKKPEILYQKT